MATLLYIHGIGNRSGAINRTLAKLKARLATEGLSDANELEFCAWGRSLGTEHRPEGFRSIPGYIERGGGQPDPLGDADEEANLWELLYRDPRFELKLLSVLPKVAVKSIDAFAPAGPPSPAAVLTAAVEKLEPSGDLLDLLTLAGLDGDFKEARNQVVRSAEFKEAVRTAKEASATNHRDSISRAILTTAVLMSESRGEAPAFLGNSELRRRLIDALASSIGPAEAAVPDWLTAPFVAMKRYTEEAARRVVSVATEAGGKAAGAAATRRAGRLADLVYETLGDVLVYQVRGREIRQAISEDVGRLAAKGKKVVLLAHSLGGIAAFEMLVEHASLATGDRPWDLNAVSVLITLGSQAPFLYEIDALQTLRRSPGAWGIADPLPPDFGAWLNLYDPGDLLSFLAAPVFPGRATDEEIGSRQPFPESHGAYWDNPKTWTLIKRYLA